MDYIKHYNRLCESRKKMNREGYQEVHHIIPKCKGGSDDPDNLVSLTAREHFIAHRLLWLHYRDRSTAMAFWSMCRGRVTDSRTYQAAKEANVFAQKGKKLSEETKAKIKANNARKGKPNWNSGKKWTKKKVQCTQCGEWTSEDHNKRWHEDKCQLAEYKRLFELYDRKEILILKGISNSRLQYWKNKVYGKNTHSA